MKHKEQAELGSLMTRTFTAEVYLMTIFGSTNQQTGTYREHMQSWGVV